MVTHWQNSLTNIRYIMDALLLMMFILSSAPQATGILMHEWISLLFIIPLVIHILLHWDWLARLPRKRFSKFNSRMLFSAIWSGLFYLMMLLTFLSGFLISEALLPSLNIPMDIQPFWAEAHHLSSNLLMVMLGIHLALYWPWIQSVSRNLFSKARKTGHKTP